MFENDLIEMVEFQIRRRGISDERILQAFKNVPRHLFVPEDYLKGAYRDCPIPIGYGQTISQPYIVAYMISELELKPAYKVLEIGTGGGYQAAILSHLVASVVSVEIIPQLAEQARKTLKVLGICNVEVLTADGSLGYPEQAPFDAILVSAAAPQVPESLLAQLTDGGRLILPVGSRGLQELEIWTKTGTDFDVKRLIPVAFVPLRGKHGW